MIPFIPFPLKSAIRTSRIFMGAGNLISKSVPGLKLNLFQAEIDIHPRDYCSLAVFTSFFYFVLLTGIISLLTLVSSAISLGIALLVGITFSVFVLMYLLNYPKLIANRRMKTLEKDLLNALHHILIEIKSGVPLFNTLVGVSEGYGEVSDEFKKVVKEINAGISEMQALDNASRRNPSLYFRRSIWQIVNALKAGSDIASSLSAIVEILTREQIIAIRRYGQELNPYTMIYMLAAVILPSLGITFLIIISSFSGLTVPKLIFPLILVFLAFFQFFYTGIIKTKRPVMEV